MAPIDNRENKSPDLPAQSASDASRERTSQAFLKACAVSPFIVLFVVAWRVYVGRASEDDTTLPAILLFIPIVLQSVGVWVLSSKREGDKKISEFYWFYLFWMIICSLACSGLFLGYAFYPDTPPVLVRYLPSFLIFVAMVPVVTMTYAIMKPPSYCESEEEKRPWLKSIFALSSSMKDSVSRVPHFATLFFFNMFMCVAYIFAFAFAYDDKATAKTDSPALFLATNLKANPLRTNSQPASEDGSETRGAGSEDYATTRAAKIWPQYKFYYRSNHPDPDILDTSSQSQNILDRIGQVEGGKVFNEWQALKNTENLYRVVNEIRKYTGTRKDLRVEVSGHTDPKDVPDGTQGARGQYGSNFDLAKARSEKLRSMIEDRLSLLKVDQSRVRIERQSLPGAVAQPPEKPDNKRKEERAVETALIKEEAALKRPEAAPTKAQDKMKRKLSDKPWKELVAIIEKVKANANDVIERIQKDRVILKAFYPLATSVHLMTVPDPQSPKELNWSDFVSASKTTTAAEEEKDRGIEDRKEALAKDLPSVEAENVRVLVAGYSSIEKERRDLREEQEFADLIPKPSLGHHGKSPTDNKDDALQRICVVDLAPVAAEPQFAPLGLMEYLYFSVYTITATGHGDIVPTTSYTRFLSTLATITEVIFLVVFFNALISLRSGHTSIHSTTQTFKATGGEGTVNVTVPAGSQWSIPRSPNDAEMVTIEGDKADGAVEGARRLRYGSGKVSYSVSPNSTGEKRVANFEIADQTFTVVQDGKRKEKEDKGARRKRAHQT